MAQTGYILSDLGAAEVRDVVQRGRKDPVRGFPVMKEEAVQGSPECYIALINSDGIDGIEETGTGSPASRVVDSTYADIYKIIRTTPGDSVPTTADSFSLVSAGFRAQVFNPYRGRVGEGFVAIFRDKFGAWITAVPSLSRYKAVITESGGIPANGSGEVTIYKGGVATAWKPDAYLDWLYVDEGLPVGQRVIIQYYEDEEHYTIEVPWC